VPRFFLPAIFRCKSQRGLLENLMENFKTSILLYRDAIYWWNRYLCRNNSNKWRL